jgi:hypothetical protein
MRTASSSSVPAARPIRCTRTWSTPCDYGHVARTAAADGGGIDAFVGQARSGLVGVIALTHQPSCVADPKLLVGLTRAEAAAIVAFLDRGDPPPDLNLIWRGPSPSRRQP